ncbi:unnamed protein product, partial [Pylaiella littoralis]
MVDGVVLLVDASEGPMSQTKFVLSKALLANKPAIVVLNKVDREGHRAEEVETDILDLFCALTSDENLLDYLIICFPKQGWVTNSIDEIPGKDGVKPLLDAILTRIPPPNSPFALGVNTIQTDTFLGRIVTGRVETGRIALGDKLKVMNREGGVVQTDGKVTKLFYLEGLQRVDVDHASAGEIISIAGTLGASVLRSALIPSSPFPFPPVVSMTFGPNNSPLGGKEGTKFTSTMIKERLQKEIENN